jgi:hypothetical protein
MTATRNLIKQLKMLTALLAALLSPLAATDALALMTDQQCSAARGTCQGDGDGTTSRWCVTSTGAQLDSCTPASNNPAPEMSDYLAAAFIVVAGAMMCRRRRQNADT